MKKLFLLALAFSTAMIAGAQKTANKLVDETKTTVSSTKSDVEGVDSIITYATTVTKTIEHVHDSIIVDTIQNVLTREDSIRVTRPAITIADSTRRGHYIQAFIGAGYSQMGFGFDENPTSLGYSLNQLGHAAGVFQVQYAYFFHENIGISAGVGVSSYGGGVSINGMDTVGPMYIGSAATNEFSSDRAFRKVENFTEMQRLWMVDVPIAMQFQGLIKPTWGLYGSVGVALSFPISSKYYFTKGTITDAYMGTDLHTGEERMRPYYTYANVGDKYFSDPIWQAEYEEYLKKRSEPLLPGTVGPGFYKSRYSGDVPWQKNERKNLPLSNIQLGLTADFGWIIPLDYQNELMVGVYARYNVLNGRTVRDDIDPSSLGFDHAKWVEITEIKSDPTGKVTDPELKIYGGPNPTATDDPQSEGFAQVESEYFNDWWYNRRVGAEGEYNENGVTYTEAVKRVNPWQVGIKIGYQWRYVRRQTYTPVEYRHFAVYDTTYNYNQRTEKKYTYTTESTTTYAYDTIMSPVDEIRRLMDMAIIWYDFDSYVPKLDPVDVLDNIAAILVQYPNLKVEVNGHTCTIGSRSYNQKLSERRAKAVADRLAALGVLPEQMVIQGFCSDKPYFSESHQLYLDRRCEIIPIESTNEKHIIHKQTKGQNASTSTEEK